MNVNIDLLQLIKDYPFYTGIIISFLLIHYIIIYKDKFISFFPSDMTELRKLNELIILIDYKGGERIKKHVKKSQRKLHFKMATGLIFNKKNEALFNYYFKHKKYGEWNQFKRIAEYIELENDNLVVKYSFSTRFVFFLFFCYWIFICLVSIILYLFVLYNINKSNYFWIILLPIITVIFTSLLMIIRKSGDIKFVKFIKNKIR